MTKKINTPTGKYALLLLACFFLIKNAHAQSVTVNRNPSGTVCEGTQVTFTAVPVGYSTPRYQWYKNGTSIPGETNIDYITSTLTNGDQIYVSCSNNTVQDMVSGAALYFDASNSSSYNGTGTKITDLTGNGRDGTMVGATGGFDASIQGGVFKFNGTDQYITTTWKPNNKMSFQLSFYSTIDYNDAWNRGLINTYPLASSPYYGIYIGTRLTNNVSAGLHFFYDNNYSANIGDIFSRNTWYILTVITDPSANSGQGSIQFYLNGATNPISTITGKTSHQGNLVIGRTGYNASAGGDFWKGYISNIIVYDDRVLTETERTQNYNATIARVGGSSSSTISYVTTVVPTVNLVGDGCVNKTVLSANTTFNSYEWSLNGSVIQGANTQNYSPTTAGNYRVKVFNGSCYGTSLTTTINVCGITATGKMSTSTSLINKLGGAASTTVKGMDERGSGINLPN